MVAEEGGAFGPEGEYVSVRLDGRGHFHITRSVDNALKVQFAPVGGDTQVLKLLVSGLGRLGSELPWRPLTAKRDFLYRTVRRSMNRSACNGEVPMLFGC